MPQENPNARLITINGRQGSGKTTLSHLIQKAIKAELPDAYVVDLDLLAVSDDVPPNGDIYIQTEQNETKMRSSNVLR